MLPFSPTGLEGKFSYACKLCSEKGVSRKEFTKSSVEEEATGTGRASGRALVGGWLASGGVRASTLDNSPKASAEGVVPTSCQGSGPILLLKQRVLPSLQLLHPSSWGC